MSSVLAQQLAQLAAAQGPQPKFIRGKPSLLYDYQKAADVGAETLLDIAQQGLEVLQRLDSRFKPFAQSLFSRSSLTTARDQLTKAENEQLDRSLRAFLQLLSGHFLTPAAFQALEYCIRRYKVNELNVHDLVLCALPFHATNEFVRLVQTLSLKGTPWEWLSPMQGSGAAMPRAVLVTRCSADPAVLSAICKAAEAMGAPRCLSRTFLSTYAVTVCEVLMAASPEVPEQLLRQLVPYLVAGLRRSASLDYRAATLMIVTQLCSVAQLSSEVLSVLVGEVCAGASPEDPRTPLMLLAHIALSQTNFQSLPAAAALALAELPGVAEAIVGLQQQGARMQSLLQLLLPALTAAAADAPAAQQLLCDLLHHVVLPPALVQEVAAQLLLEGGTHYRDAAQGAPNSSKKKTAAAEAAVERLQQVCRVLDLRWAQQLDAAINQVLQEGADADQDASVAEGVFRFVQEACGAQHSMVNCAGQTATLAAAVGAPAAAMRVMALRKLDALCADESAEPSTASQELLVTGLLSGLLDDSFAVAAVAAGAAGLALVPPQELLHALQQLLARAAAAVAAGKGLGSPKAAGSSPGGGQDTDTGRKEAGKAAKRALQAAAQLGERDSNSRDAAAGLVLSLLLVTSRKGRKVAKAALEAASAMGYHPLMAAFAESAAADPVLGAGAVASPAKLAKGKQQQSPAAEQGAVDDGQYNAHLVRALAAALHSTEGLEPASAVAVAAAADPLGQHLLALALCCHSGAAAVGSSTAQATSGSKRSKKATAAAAGGTPAAGPVLAELALHLAVPAWAAANAVDTASPSVGGPRGSGKAGLGLAASSLAAAGALLDEQGLPSAKHQDQLQAGSWQQQQQAVKLLALQQQLQDLPGGVWAEAVVDPVRLFACLVAVAPPAKAGPCAVVPVLHVMVNKVVSAGQQQQSALQLLSDVYGLPAGVAGASVQVAALQVLAAVFEAAAGAEQVPTDAGVSPVWLLRLLAAAASGEPSVRAASVSAAAAVLGVCQASPQSPVAGDSVTGAQLVPLLEALVSQQQLVQQNSAALRLLLQHIVGGPQEVPGVGSPRAHTKGSKVAKAASKLSLSPDLTAQLPVLGELLTQLLVTQLPQLTGPSDWVTLELAATVLASSGHAQQQQVAQALVPALQHLGQLLLTGGVVPIAAAASTAWEQLAAGTTNSTAPAALTTTAEAAAQQLLSAMAQGPLQASPEAVDLLCHLLLAGHTSEGWSAAATAEGLAVASPVRAAAVALVSPQVYAAVTLGHQEQLLKGLVLMAAADGDQACRDAARRALEVLPLTAEVLRLPLQRLQLGLTGQNLAAAAAAPTPSKKRRTTKSSEQSAAAGGPLTAADVALATAVLELLQWSSSVAHPEQLVGALQALLQSSLPRLGTIVEAHGEGAQPASSSLLPPALAATAAADVDEEPSPPAADMAVSPASLGYIAQLVLQVLQQLAGQVPKPTKTRPSSSSSSSSSAAADFDVALVLEVARGAPDAAVRNAALSLWGALAARSPEGMLGYVLQALTLIHESAAVYDDSHSHRVTSDTLAAVVPPWLAAGHPAQQLWATLVEALPQLPPHRRLGLLTALLGALPMEQGLWVALLLLLRKAEAAAAAPPAAGASGEDAAAAASGDSWWLQLAAALCAKVPAAERVEAFGRLLPGCLADSPAAPSAPLSRLVVAFVTRQLQVKTLLGAAAAVTGEPTPPKVQAACAEVLQQAVLLLQQLHPGAAASSSTPTSPKGAKKLQRAVKAATTGLYDLLRALSTIIDAAAYLRVLVQLVGGSSSEKVVRKALQLFADRMDKVELDLVDLEGLPAGQRKQAEAQLAEAALQLLGHTPKLLDAVATPSALTRQHALLACQTAVRAFGAQQPGSLLPVVPGVLAAAKDATAAVRASALACVAALVGALGTQLISQLPAVAGAVLAAAEGACSQLQAASAAQQQQGSDEEEEEGEQAKDAATGQAALELASALAALESLVKSLGAFLSPYLPRLVQLLVHPAVLGCSTAGAADTAVRLRVLLPCAVPARLLLEPLSAQWEYALGLSLSDAGLAAAAGAAGEGGSVGEVAHQPAAVLLGMLVDLVSGLETKLAAVYYEGVFGLLLKALDTRRRWMETCSSSSSSGDDAVAGEGVASLGPAGVHEVESAAARALVALTMKLSESRFKPLFLRLLDWAATSLGAAVAAAQSAAAAGEEVGGAAAAAGGGDGGLGRTLALLSAVVALSHRLRSVFVPYYKYILDLLLAQLTGAAAAAAGVRPPKKKRRKSAAAVGPGEAGSSKDAALQLAVWLARVRSVQALHLLFIHSSGSEQQQKQEQLERVLQPLVDQLQEGPAGDAVSPGTHSLLSLLSQQCADAELDVHGGVVAALGEAGEAAVAAIGAPLPASVTDVAGLAAVGALLAGAASTGSDMSWKPVHHSVLVATRKGGVRAKLLALGLLSRLVASLQEEYLVLLPEALPFIAELLEDLDASVEGAVQGLVAQLEKVSGESLQQYLKV